MRKITLPQALTFGALLALALAASAWSAALVLGVTRLGEFRGIAALIAFIVLSYVYAMVVHRIFLAFAPLKAGEIAPGSREEFHYHVYLLFYLVLFHALVRNFILPTPVMRMVYLALGARLGTNTYSAGVILDPPLTVVGDNTIIGHDALVFAHVVEGARLAFAPVHIGNDVTIGAKAVIMPGVRIDDGAIVAIGAVVSKGTHIAAGEVWGGVPARRLRAGALPQGVEKT